MAKALAKTQRAEQDRAASAVSSSGQNCLQLCEHYAIALCDMIKGRMRGDSTCGQIIKDLKSCPACR